MRFSERRDAESRVWMISLLFVLFLSASTFVCAADDEEDQPSSRLRIASFIDMFPEAPAEDTGNRGTPEKAMEVYSKWLEQNRSLVGKDYESMSPSEQASIRHLMESLYPAAGDGGHAFKTVAYLIEHGLPAPSKQYLDKGYRTDPIDASISQSMAKARDAMIHELINSIGERQKWQVCISDSGNTSSGMKSDLDQTVYVYKLDAESKTWVRDESLDAEFIRLFQQEWEGRFGQLSVESLDMASIPGRSRFPDPRVVSNTKFFESFKGTIDELRRTPGAYTTYGAVVQQMQLRALEQIELENTRAFQVFGPEEGKTEGTWSRHGEFNQKLAMETMFYRGIPPELMTQHAFGASVANYFELLKYMHKPKFETKYHMRTWDDCMYTMFLLKRGVGREGKREYLSLSPDERAAENGKILAELFPGDAKKQRHHAMALEISLELRRQHKGAAGAEEAVRAAEYELARDMFGDRFDPQASDSYSIQRTRTQVDAARQYYRRLASEFSLASIHYSSADAFRLMLPEGQSRPLLEQTKALVDPDGKLDWENYSKNTADASRLTLLYAIYDLGLMKSAQLMAHINSQVPDHKADLARLWLEGQVVDTPRKIENLRAEAEAIGRRARTHALSELGFENAEEVRLSELITDHQNITWNWRKLGNNMFNDLGTVDSLAQILLTFYESQGDMDQVFAKAQDELFLAIPIVGQIEQFRRADMLQAGQILLVMKYAALGKAMVVYSIGSTTYRIFEFEVAEPYYGNVVDAIYRGFVGPELRDYGEPGRPPAPPVVFTEQDEKRMRELRSELSRIAAILTAIDTGRIPAPLPDNRDRVDLIGDMTDKPFGDDGAQPPVIGWYIEKWRKDRKKYVQQKADAEEELAALTKKERMWKWYRAGPHEGGIWSGIGARPDQQWLSISLLDDVTLRHAFLTQGAVDLERELDVDATKEEIGNLRRQIAQATSIEELLDAKTDLRLNELELQLKRYERARRYENELNPDGVNKKLASNRELRYRFRRDSLYRHFQQNKINVDRFVEDWFTRNKDVLKKELEALDLFSEEVVYEHTGRQVPTAVFTGKVDPKIRQRVKERLKADIERSRILLAAYLKTEQARKDKQDKNVVDAARLIGLERLGASLEDEIAKEKFSRFLTALRYSAVPRFKPRVKVTFFKAPVEPSGRAERGRGKEGEKLRESFRLDCKVQVDADPTLYIAPYKAEIHYLGSDGGDVELLPDTQQAIGQLRSKHAEALREGDGIIAVASVFAARTPDLSGAIPATIANLPGLKSGGSRGPVLFGQSAAFIESKPVEVRVDPIKVLVLDWAGNRLSEDACKTLEVKLVEAGGEERLLDLSPNITEPEFVGSHAFTTFGEKVTIQVAFTVADGSVVHGKESISIDDVSDWNDPACLEPIEIRLPILASGLTVKGNVELRAKKDTDSYYPEGVRLRLPEFDISENIEITEAGKGSFDFPLLEPAKIHSLLQATAQAVITVRTPQTDGQFLSRDVTHAGKGSASVPDEPGIVDLGTIALVPSIKMVRVPEWDYERPPKGQVYLDKLTEVDLRGAPRIGKRPSDAAREFCVESVMPSPGTEVPTGTRVAVSIYGEFACRVPDVVGMKAADAVKTLKDAGFKESVSVGQAAKTVDKEFVVQSQGIEPGTKRDPGTPIPIVLYGKTVAMVKIPDVRGTLLAKAEREIRDAGLRVEVDRERPTPGENDRPGTVDQQVPRHGSLVEAGTLVRLRAFGRPEVITPEEQTYPYYQLFQLYAPQLKDQYSQLAPAQRNGESKGAYFERKKAFFNSQPLNHFDLAPQASTMVMHVSGNALNDYPPSFFRANERYFMKFVVEANPRFRPGGMLANPREGEELDRALAFVDGVFRENPDMRLPFNCGFLLMAQGRYTSLEQLNRDAPPARDDNGVAKRSVFFFKDGKQTRRSPSPASKTVCVFGPVTPGWTAENVREAAQLVAICFVATAVYGDADAPQVLIFREFRDRVLLATPEGRELVRFYYHHGPGWARWVLDHPASRRVLRPIFDAMALGIGTLDYDDSRVQTACRGVVQSIHGAFRYVDADVFDRLPPLEQRFHSAVMAFDRKENRHADAASLSP